MTIKKFLVFPVALAMLAFGTFGTAHAQTVYPRLAIELLNTGLTTPITAGSDDATVARLVLDTRASTEAVRISSLPFILATGNNAVASDLQNCRVYNEADMDDALSAGTTLNTGLNNVALSSTITLAANTVTTLALQCDIDETLVAGGTFTFSMNTANVSAVGATTNLPAIVTVRGSVVVPPVVPPVVVVPGLPTTGASSDAGQNIAFLLGSVLLAGLGVGLMRKADLQKA